MSSIHLPPVCFDAHVCNLANVMCVNAVRTSVCFVVRIHAEFAHTHIVIQFGPISIVQHALCLGWQLEATTRLARIEWSHGDSDLGCASVVACACLSVCMCVRALAEHAVVLPGVGAVAGDFVWSCVALISFASSSTHVQHQGSCSLTDYH